MANCFRLAALRPYLSISLAKRRLGTAGIKLCKQITAVSFPIAFLLYIYCCHWDLKPFKPYDIIILIFDCQYISAKIDFPLHYYNFP
jgi:hypothetical protein